MKSNIVTLAFASAIAFGLVSQPALAGKAASFPVTIVKFNDGTVAATGDTRSARRSSNSSERIECNVTAFETSAGDPNSVRFLGSCTAQDAGGRTAVCITRNPRLLEIINNATSYAFILFEARSDGGCRRIGYTHSSTLLP